MSFSRANRVGEEIRKENLCHRPSAGHGRAHRRSDDGVLADGCVHDPLGAELVDQPDRHREVASRRDVLAQEIGPLVALELLAQRLEERLRAGDLSFARVRL